MSPDLYNGYNIEGGNDMEKGTNNWMMDDNRAMMDEVTAAFAKFHAVLARMPDVAKTGEAFDFWNEKMQEAERDLVCAVEAPRLEFARRWFSGKRTPDKG